MQFRKSAQEERAQQARKAQWCAPTTNSTEDCNRMAGSNGWVLVPNASENEPEKVDEFIRTHTVPYEKIVTQRLWYHDSTENMPSDYQLCTLPQAFQRGFGAGQAKLARQLLEERRSHEGDVQPRTTTRRS